MFSFYSIKDYMYFRGSKGQLQTHGQFDKSWGYCENGVSGF